MATTHYRPADAAAGSTPSRFVAACGRDAHYLDGTDRREYVECGCCRRVLGQAPARRAAGFVDVTADELVAALEAADAS